MLLLHCQSLAWISWLGRWFRNNVTITVPTQLTNYSKRNVRFAGATCCGNEPSFLGEYVWRRLVGNYDHLACSLCFYLFLFWDIMMIHIHSIPDSNLEIFRIENFDFGNGFGITSYFIYIFMLFYVYNSCRIHMV